MASIAFSFAFPLSDFVTITYVDGMYSYSGKTQERKIVIRDKNLEKQKSDHGVGLHNNVFQNHNNPINGESVIHLRAKANSNPILQGSNLRTLEHWYSETSQDSGNDMDSTSISLSSFDETLSFDVDTRMDKGT